MLERSLLCALIGLACASVSAAPPPLYKCVDDKGKTYYTQTPPVECLGKATQELSRQGRVIKQNEILTPEEIAAREAEKKRKAEADKLAGEQRRKNVALLNTYSSEKDIDEARSRALKQAEDAISSSEKKIGDAVKRRGGFEKEKEFYVKKPLPAKLQQDIQNNERDIKNEQDILEAKKKEISSINTKYDDDKRRYLELTRPKK
jgi:uncharacterized protein DUF4124